jgi:hypothetical protein
MAYKTVLVRGLDGHPTPFALLSATATAVFVCREDLYEDVVSGRREPPLIGFPVEDVSNADGSPFVPPLNDLKVAA